MSNYSKYTNQNVSHKKLGDFVQDMSSTGFGLDLQELLEYSGDNGFANYDLIYAALFTENQDIAYKFKDTILNYKTKSDEELKQIPFPQSCTINIPFSKIDRSLGFTQSTNFINSTDYESFLSKNLYDLLNDVQYRVDASNKAKSIDNVQDIFNNITVWVWSKSLSRQLQTTEKKTTSVEKSKSGDPNDLDTVNINITEEDNYKDTLIDITPFIYNLNTNVTETGGNFSFNVAPILAEFKDGKWVVDSNSVKIGQDYYTADTFVHSIDGDNSLKRNQIYFNNVLQNNDVVFIRFEKLELEQDRVIDYTLEVNKSELPNKIYDMIGLIDNVSESYNGQSNNLDINVSGRDLIKLFIEDGVYFYPFQFTNGGIFANVSGAAEERLNRFGKGDIKSRFQFYNKTLQSTMQYVINALSTIEITSNTLFESYKDKRTDVYKTDGVDTRQQDRADAINDRKKKIISLIESARKKDNLDKFNEESSEAVYNKLTTFVQSIVDAGVQIDENGTLKGWGNFQFDTETLKANQIAWNLDDSLYRPQYGWRDSKGNILNSARKNALIDNIQKTLDDIINKSSSILNDLGQSNDTRQLNNQLNKGYEAQKAYIKGGATDDQNRYIETGKYINDLQLQILKQADNQPATIRAIQEVNNASTQQIIASDQELFETQRQANIKLAELDAQYEVFKAKKENFFLVQIPSYFDKLTNNFAVEAFQEAYKLVKDEDIIRENRVLSPVKGIWQIIKLVIDDSVANRRVVDSSIGNENGSLLNAMNKICLKPFVEFYTDTYGDQFHIVVRKQPFDKASIISYLDKTLNNKPDVAEKETSINPLRKKLNSQSDTYNSNNIKDSIVIQIEESDVLSTNLSFDNTAYSWYRVQMVRPGAGTSNSMAFAYLKAIYFPEYADIYGSKPYDKTTNYIPYLPLPDKGDKVPNAYFIQQGITDLKYLIDCNCYLPFTRKGSIVINGDRTIKRGTFIKLNSTNEIYYVDSVSNSYSISSNAIDRTTTLNVSRGMKENYIKGEEINGTNYSYFNICNTEINDQIFRDDKLQYETYSEAIANTWKVNKKVFNFFLKRYQFADIEQVTEILNQDNGNN